MYVNSHRPNYGRGNCGNGNLLQKDLCTHCCIQGLWPRSRPLLTHASTRDSWTLTGKYSSVSCGDTAPISWLLVCTKFCTLYKQTCTPNLFPQSCGSSVIKSHWPPKRISWESSVPLPDPQVRKYIVGPRTFLTVQDFLWYYCSVWFVGHLLGGSIVARIVISSKRAYATPCMTQVYCSQSPCPHSWPLLTHASAGDTQTLWQVWLSFCGVSWCAQGFVWALLASLVGMGFDSKHDFAPPTILLGFLHCPWMGWVLIIPFAGINITVR